MEERERDGFVQRLFGLAIGHHLDPDHQAASAYVADKPIFLLQFLQRLEHYLADAGGIFDESLVDDRFDGAKAGRGSERISTVTGRAAARLTERPGRHELV